MYYGKIKNDHIISDRVIYLATLCNNEYSPIEVQKITEYIMASFHDKDNAHKFLEKLSIHPLTKENTLRIAKKAFSNIYENDLTADHCILETTIEFADAVSYHLKRIADEYRDDCTYIAYMIVFNSIKLFTYKSDANIFASRVMDKMRGFSICSYIGNCLISFDYMRTMVPSDKINLTENIPHEKK